MTTNSFSTPSPKKLWLAAIKPPMYSVAIMPIIVGTSIAFQETKLYNGLIFSTFLLSAIGILAWLNLSNDVFDSETGIDKNKAHSVVNLTGNKSLVFWLSNLLLVLGIGGIVAIAFWQENSTVLVIILGCCFLGYTYQGPPFRLGYQGLGEFICFFTFGPMAISAAYYAQTASFSRESIAASFVIGVTTTIILFCSHFHQVADDLAAGKKSPIVRLGTEKGSRVLTGLTLSIYLITAMGIIWGLYPLHTALIFLSLPWGWNLIRHVQKYHAQPQTVSNSKFLAVNLHFISGILFSIGYLWS
ncbi:MAG: 1,4-dihydroxy-2-naphthoate octaprenyltransferase [Chroococcopsis gigantea SAG 12.99]|jgi:1,4-dihydroxy-2-naphthoate phytyltransferase|nr:2-carboxy-1,4-naphthoquinone phytyltransferase [Chlorogloea purpurea SAG 13.99]MDV2999272.1 1,4-dihydroxy-2-naphthoate octaprenyltransferase [Chroococcopsis gigantea SAG 12.99]